MVNTSTQTSALHSSTGMDAGLLHELGNQLKHSVQEQAAKSGLQVELSVPELPTLSILNPSPCTLSGPQLLHKLALSGAHDSNPAIEFLCADGNVRCLSYRSLDQLSSKLAAEIASASVARADGAQNFVVPVLLPQSLELYIAWLAILKAGGAFCPLNIDAPPDRIEFILQDVAASVVVTQGTLTERVLQDERLAVINVDGIEKTDDTDAIEPVAESSPSDLAYVMYTSGSTGRPKGVGVSHLAATQSLLAHDDLIPPFSRFLQFASPTFDVSVFEVFFPLMRGATLIGCEREQMLLDISHVMTEMQVDAAELTPTVAGELLRTRASAPSLQVLLTIGEMLTKHVVEEFGQSANSDGVLHGMYGPTEAAIHCTAATHFQASSRMNLIGKPFKTVSAFIMSLDSKNNSSPEDPQPLPLGQIGELVVGGPQLADGYINRPEENAKAFIEISQYGRLYRTGDKARMLPSGEIECFGRISSGQVKVRGQRIELGEIEHVVCRAAEVRSAVAIVSGGSLVAFVLISDKGTTDRALRDTCRQWLPRFMVPGEFILVNQFPQLPSGKIDRKALEADFIRHRNATQSVDQPSFRDETEETIASCVSDVLGRPLPPAESLVAAGLDSLSAIRLASHLLDAGIRLDVTHLLEADCVDGIWQLAKELETAQTTENSHAGIDRIRQLVADAGAARIEALGLGTQVTRIEPCSHIQQAMILETVRHSKAYCNWIELEFQRSGSLDSTAIHNAFVRLLEQNELLRSGFVEISLKDHSYACFTWKAFDKQLVQKRDVFDYDICLIAEQDLLHPLRIQLKETPRSLRALVHLHHALYDGWSWQLMLKDLHRLLLGEELPPKPAYGTVTNFFIEHKLSKSADESLIFWRDQLQGSSGATFPNFHGRTDVSPGTEEATRVLDISMSTLNKVSQSLRVSRQTIFQAAFCYILSSYLGSNDVVFGTVFSGRTLPVKGIEAILGPCIRTLPTRMDLEKMQNAMDLLLAIQNMNHKFLEHGSLPLQDIKKASGLDMHLNLFDTALVWQESIWSDEAHRTLFREIGAAEFLEFALFLEFEPREDNVHAKATFHRSTMPLGQAQILLEQIDCVASILINSPRLSIEEINGHLPQTTLSVFNPDFETQRNLPSLALGVEQVAFLDSTRTAIELVLPSKIADTFTHIESITYGQLNSRANRLAHNLLQLGVGQGDLCAILIDKSMDSYISMLAIAKVGAGFLPLSPLASSKTIHSILTAATPQFCIIQSSKRLGEMPALKSIPHILLQDSFDNGHDYNPPTTDEGLHVVCVDMTSSSDDLMKPVSLSHQNLQSHINVLAETFPTPTGSKLLQSSPHASVGYILESFFGWHTGMTLCSALDYYLTVNIDEIIKTRQITHLHLTPTLASRLHPNLLPSVQHVLISGEPSMVKVHQDWAEKGLYQGYSSPGITGVCTICPNVKKSTYFANIGMPLKNASAMIVANKTELSLLPRGALGELCFGGDQVTRVTPGSKTPAAGSFIDHPQFGRLYRTGDLGRLLPDGSFILLPRRDHKLHGQCIDLDEIDRVIILSELVENAYSIVWNNPSTHQQQLATIWIPSDDCQKTSDSSQLNTVTRRLFEELAASLPSSTVPSLLVPVSNIPMTEFHQRDHEGIRQLFEQLDSKDLELFARKVDVDAVDHNLTDVEQTIASALSAVTGTDPQTIRKHTSFYKLGLDSLSAISFSRKLQESGCGRLAVSTILQHSSVAQLATVIPALTNRHQPEQPSLLKLTPAFDENLLVEVKNEFSAKSMYVQGVYPCTPLQEAMLAAEFDVNSAYFNHLLLRVNTNVEALKAAWTRMLHRHDILRTCFRPTNDKGLAYAQVVLSSAALPWSYVEISNELDESVEKIKSDFECQSPINGKLPYSLTIFADSATHDAHLLLSIHHALYDGAGIAQLLHEVQLSLADQELPVTTPFHRFIDYMLSASSGASNQYWDRYLSGVSPSLLSISGQTLGSLNQSASQQIHTNLTLPLDSFQQQCKELSMTPLNIFHAAWARLLALHSGSSDVCFGNVFSCRTVPLEGADRIVGPCFNTLPVRVKFSSTSTNADIMKLSQKHNSDILPHQLSSLRHIQRRVLHGSSRLFDTLVILQTRSTELDSHYWKLLRDEGNMGFPLICEVVPDKTSNTVHICLHFQTSHVAHAVAQKLAQDLVALVEHTIQFPSGQASDKRPIGSSALQVFEKRQSPQVNITRAFPTNPHTTRPWSYQEEALRDVLCKFSGVDPVAVALHTTIFQLGLDSINAVQISGTLRRLGYKISAGDILEAASIDKIASLLETSGKCAKEDEFDFSSFESQHLQPICYQLGIFPEVVQCLRPCTHVQNGMLALFTHSNGNMYFNRMTLRSSTPLDKASLREAWSKVMAQHEMLRTGFVQLQNQQYPFAMITYQTDLDLPWNEMSGPVSVPDPPGVQERRILENLHRPPWGVTVESGREVTTMHFSAFHAIYDVQSLASIFSDVMTAYEGRALIEPASITATLGPILIESQKQIETAQEFWQSLASEIQPCKFPELNPVRTERKELLVNSIRCSRSLRTLEGRCRDIGVTLQAAGQAAWARLLAAYIGEQNVVFGTVLSGRNLSAAAQDAIFPCLVTVPSPSRIEGTNRELLYRTLKRNSHLTKNQFTPLAHIQRWLGSDEPLFDTLFVFQKFASRSAHFETWKVVDEETKIDYPVSIELIPHSTDLEIRISYRSDLLPEEQATTLLSQYDKLLEQTLLSPDSNSDDYLFLGNKLLSVTPAKEEALPTSVSLLHQFVEENAQIIPEKTALEFAFGLAADSLQKKTWSYRELNEDGNRVAHFLQNKGVAPGGMIAICFDKCPEASIAILGILKAGCAYLAIDPTAPSSRKQFILEDSNTKILLCNQARMVELENLSGVDIHALDEPDILKGIPFAQPLLLRQIRPDDTCYCLYTSGTTGTPKGCEITHGNAVQAMLSFQRLFSPNWDEESRWLQFASFHFDVSVLEQYWSWSVGICVTSCPRDLLFEDLPGMIQKLQITHIDLTPSLAKLVHPDEVPSLCRGVFITGGEALKQEILDAWGKHGVIYNGYGPTEVTIGCTMLPRMRAHDKPTNIGPQFDNVGSYVFRPGTSTPVLRGGLGELCVSGPLVGKGYLNRAELTKERFQVLPDYEDRIYRTGDLVRILHDGSFQFLGRIDDQVKLRGQRLEIGEINEVIKQASPELNEVATLVIKHPKQSKDQLVSFVTKVDAGNKSRAVEIASGIDSGLLSTIKAACHTHLPGYMVPTHIIPLSRFPLSANNKADMKVLKSIYQELSLEDLQDLTSMAVHQSVKSAHEENITSVLAEFIGSTDTAISPWSSIFELGLDSISVISFSRSLREAGLTQAQPSLIMKHPTVAGMAVALQASTTPSISSDNLHRNAKQAMEAFAHKHFHSIIENIGILNSEVEQIAPCTPLQEGIIYHFLSSSTSLYCSSFTFELNSLVNFDKLQAAWKQAQSYVQMLRARFLPSPDGYAQVILKKDSLSWFHTKVASEQVLESSRRQQLENWTSRLDSLTLTTQLWEVGLVTSPEKSVMCLNIFHALYDGNSLALLLDLVARIYRDEKNTLEHPLDFLDVLHLGPLCKDPSAEAFWRNHLANCQNRALVKPYHGTIIPFVEKIQIETTEHLDRLRKSLNITEQAVLHACWLLTLHQHYSFVPPLGIIASGRTVDVPGIADVIGPLFNTIPSNVQLRGLKSWAEVAQKCHEYHVFTIPFQYTALRDIVKWLGRNPDERLFDSLFVFQRDGSESESPTGSLWHPLNSEAQHEYPLALELVRNGNESLSATLAAKSHVMSPEVARQILSSFKQLLSEFAENPERQLPYINGVAEREQAQTNGETLMSEEPLGFSDRRGISHFQWISQACIIRDVIANLAGVEVQSVGEETSIFEVGLDSIDAIKLSSRLSKSGIKLPVSAIMRHRNVKAMTRQLEVASDYEQNGTHSLLSQMEELLTNFVEGEGLVPPATCRILPATPIQEAMVAEMSASEYERYYNHEVLQIEPNVDLTKLREAWRGVVRAHPILRTSFIEVWDPKIPASYAQVVHGEETFDFRTVYLDGKSMNSVIKAQRARAITELAGQPLLTITAVVDGNARYLVLSIAHALYDGWSVSLLHEDVVRSYTGQDCTRPPPDAILEQIIASSGERALKFWRATLSNCTPTIFPLGPHSEGDSKVVHRAERLLSASSEKSEAFCKRHGITMQALLVSCWSLVLATYVKKLDVVFGLVLSGRNMADSEDVMFPTMNTVAMRVILHGSRIELVKYIQETLLDMSEHQHFPLRRARPDTGSRQLFDTLFIYQKRPSESHHTEPVLYQSTGGSSDVEYPVCAEVEGVGADLVGRVACRGSVCGQEDAFALLGHIAHVLSSIVDDPAQQTVDFHGDTMEICGSTFSQDVSVQDVDKSKSPIANSSTEWSPIETNIRDVLSIVSGVPEESIDKQANIFQLGLDSISAIKVAALLKKKSVKLAVSDMLRAGTIENMARVANNHHAELTPTEITAALTESLGGIDIDPVLQAYGIAPHRVKRTFPATAGQIYFLAMHTLNPEVFYPKFFYTASKRLSWERLDMAWTHLADQIPILRTAFAPTSSSPQCVPFVQVVLNRVHNPVVWHDNIDELVAAHFKQGFGLIPATLHGCQTSEGTVLGLQIHHALYDAVSLSSMTDRLAQLCSQAASESKAHVNDLSQLVAYQQVHSPVEVRRQFWQRYLGHIATDGAGEQRVGSFGAIQPHYRPGLVSNMSCVEIAAQRRGLSFQSIFLAVFARVHARMLAASGTNSQEMQSQLVVGLYLANRSHDAEGLSELIAPTVNIVPLRLGDKLSDNHESLFVAARKIQDDIQEISMIQHAGVSLVEIAKWTGVRISTCVNFLRLPDLESASAGVNDSLVFKSIQREDLGASQLSSLSQSAVSSPTNGDIAASVPAPAIDPATSTAAIEDVFWPTIDVEAAIRDDRLDFGIFAPEGRLDHHTAEQTTEGIQREMTALVDSSGLGSSA